MKIKLLFSAIVLIVGLSGFTVPGTEPTGAMIPGMLYNMKDGTIISCSMEYSSGQGRAEATNTFTGEKFMGLYTGVFENDKFASGDCVLLGDKGTVIGIHFKINIGSAWNQPFGYGDGEDNFGVKYQYHTKRQ